MASYIFPNYNGTFTHETIAETDLYDKLPNKSLYQFLRNNRVSNAKEFGFDDKK